jgi:hypothetical protein
MYMNGVDHADQLRSTYNTARKSLKWWKYLFFFLLDVSIVNAYLLMRESENHKLSTKNNKEKPRTQIEFRMNLAHQLLGGFTGKRKRTPDIQPMVNPIHVHVVQFYRQRARNFLYRAILLFSADRCGITITVGRQN